MDYNELYEFLRKEKYADPLQALAPSFVEDVSAFLRERRANLADNSDLFSEETLKSKKQFENAISLFRELMRIRKRKILNLVFVASETGIMKRDFSTLLSFEHALFERLVSAVDDADKEMHKVLNGGHIIAASGNTMVLVQQHISAFVDTVGT